MSSNFKIYKCSINLMFFLFVFLFSISSCICQNEGAKNSDLEIVTRYELKANSNSDFIILDNYLIANDIVEFNILGDENNYALFLVDLAELRSVKSTNEFGLYLFGQHSSHQEFYLYFKNSDDTFLIVDVSSTENKYENLMKTLNDFFIKNRITSESLKVKYLFGLIKLFNQEFDYPISDKCIQNSWNCGK